MIDFTKLKRDRRKFLALTGLTLKAFNALLPAFASGYESQYSPNRTKTGRKRQRQRGGGRRGVLNTMEQRLLFILVYQKTYLLQEVMGALFGMSQSAVNQWIHQLLPVLRNALTALGLMPEREGRKFAGTERRRNEPREYIIDGTERRCQQPKNPEKQALFYSGKKKAHTHKNVLVVNTRTKRVGYLSPTSEGKIHDKKLADRTQLTYPRRAVLHKDTAALCGVSACGWNMRLLGSSVRAVSRTPYATRTPTVRMDLWKLPLACTIYAFGIANVACDAESKTLFLITSNR